MSEEAIQIDDKELLTLAAKAVDIDLLAEEWEDGFIYYYYKIPGDTQGWNPLNCDSDALRLAVKLGVRGYFDVEIQKGSVQVTSFEPYEHTAYEEFKIRTEDPHAAVRRAIVEAAAEIGRKT